MTPIRVKDLMIYLDRYAVVSVEASLYEAIVALETARASLGPEHDRYRGILVLGNDHNVVGKLDLWDLLRGLEPRYGKVGYPRELSSNDCSGELAGSIFKTYGLWRDVLDGICEQTSKMSVKDIMHVPKENEYIEADACLEEATNKMLVYNHQSLIVTKEGKAIGILRLIDVLRIIIGRVGVCRAYSLRDEEEEAEDSLAA